MRQFISLLAILIATAAPVAARVTLEDADKVMESRDAELQAFQDRLNDPDPEKALAILKLLIVQGDADQRRMAIRHGLHSTDSALRATTIRAIFDSEPTLVMKFKPVSDEPGVYYTRAIKQAGGVLSEDNSSEVMRKITGYDEEHECWIYTSGTYTPCFTRMRGEVVSVSFGDSWGNYTLNDKGELEGQQSIGGNLAKAVIELYE